MVFLLQLSCTIEGTYKNGKVELAELPAHVNQSRWNRKNGNPTLETLQEI